MGKGVKIGIIIVSVVLVFSVLGYAIGSGKFSKKDETTAENTTSSATADTTENAGGQISGNEADSAESTQKQEPSLTASQTETPDNTSDESLLLGCWTDGAGMSGFDFHKDGTVKVTYVNVTIPVINIPVNGSYTGTYTVDDGVVTTTFSIYTATITNRYRFSVTDSQLTLTNLEDMKQSVYMRTVSDPTTVVQDTSSSAGEPDTQATQGNSSVYNSEISGSWVSNDGKIYYTFGNDGSFSVRYNYTKSDDIPAGTYKGLYIFDGDSLTIQYTAGKKVTEKYECISGKNSITLIDDKEEQYFFVREGTGSAGISDASSLIGKWTDGAGMSGYEFHEDGRVTLTYVNITVPVVNIPINGTYDGAYSVSGNRLSISFSVYGKVIRRSFTFSVDGSSLTLTDENDGKVSSYLKG